MDQGYAHLSYYPNREEYTARETYRLQQEPVDHALPESFPRQLGSKMVWDGQSLSLEDHQSSDGTKCTLLLDGSQLMEIDVALRSFQGTYLVPN